MSRIYHPERALRIYDEKGGWMSPNEIYEAGKQRVEANRRQQSERRAEVARILVEYPKQVERHRARMKEAYSLLFSLLVAGYFDEAATKKVQEFLTEEGQR